MRTDNTIKIASAAMEIFPDIESNASTMMMLTEQATDQGAQIIHFPEGALSGYVKSQIKSWDEFDWQCLDKCFDDICGAAEKHQIHMVFGSCCQQNDKLPTNCLYVVDTQGSPIARYDKRYCSHSEISGWYSAGNRPVTFDVAGFRFGLALCIEVQFPEVFLEYETLDVDCVLFSAYNRDPMFVTQSQGHAACNNVWISYCGLKQCQDACNNTFIGPDGTILSAEQLGDLTLIELDRRDPQFDIALNKARPWRRTARKGDIYK